MEAISNKYDLKGDRQYNNRDIETRMTREACGRALLKHAEEYKNLVVVTADLMYPTKVDEFASNYPERFFNFGVAEQNMMSIAAGMASCGKIVFTTTFAVFATTRACEQVRTDIAYTNMNVKIIGTASGFSFGMGGVTHAAYEDVAIMRNFPNMTVVYPVDAMEAEKTVEAAIKKKGPFYIRVGRGGEPVINKKDYDFEIGKGKIYRHGRDLTVIANGPMVFETLLASEILIDKYGIDIEIINMHTIKPIDKDMIIDSAKKTKNIMTIEEHNIIGGLGSAVAEVIAENCAGTRFLRLGIMDIFPIPGKPEELRRKYGLDQKSIAQKVRDFLNN